MYTHGIKKELADIKDINLIFIDLICLNVAFFFSYSVFSDLFRPYSYVELKALILMLCFADMFVALLLSSYTDFSVRGYYKEFVALMKQTLLLFLIAAFFIFSLKSALLYSRKSLLLMAVFYFSLDYIVRIAVKKLFFMHRSRSNVRSLLIVSDRESVENVIMSLDEHNISPSYFVSGFVLTDADETEVNEKIDGIPVVCSIGSLPHYICRSWVDDVFISTTSRNSISQEILAKLAETGVVIHTVILNQKEMLGQKQFVEKIGGFNVMTSCMKDASWSEAAVKRAFDIVGGFVGCIVTAVLFMFIAPIIKICSPGPIFFRQERVGKNGKKFFLYKFRSMEVDADEQKKELAAANRISDGMMFKLEFDPRVIGNKILPDGRKKTGIGNFLRVTSIDEFPQFFNVLKGDMSLVGTRPPTLDEWEKYSPHHRARLAIKPGITGMWQVSGRSEITDFEEVVALDTKYINEWSIGLDIKILLKTVFVMFRKDGAM